MNPNRLELSGRIGTDIRVSEMRSTGAKVANFNMAHDRGYWNAKTKSFVKMPTMWIRVSCWTGADYLSKTLRKGQTVLVIGELSIDDKTGEDKNNKWITLQVRRHGDHGVIPLADKKRTGSDDEYTLSEEEESEIAVDDDGTPF